MVIGCIKYVCCIKVQNLRNIYFQQVGYFLYTEYGKVYLAPFYFAVIAKAHIQISSNLIAGNIFKFPELLDVIANVI